MEIQGEAGRREPSAEVPSLGGIEHSQAEEPLPRVLGI